VTGGSADDVLIGDAGSNELHGGAGDDTLQGATTTIFSMVVKGRTFSMAEPATIC